MKYQHLFQFARTDITQKYASLQRLLQQTPLERVQLDQVASLFLSALFHYFYVIMFLFQTSPVIPVGKQETTVVTYNHATRDEFIYKSLLWIKYAWVGKH